ncbi:MAG: FlgD immunoglobulin-like domain containing protein [Candidatus Krumholzibacteria bacterium]|nr:FlgD immunoglobulin-like domain containing protein [Candidatus Krumholzibacteria bacterium]
MSSVRNLILALCLLMLSASSAFAYSFRLEITATGSLDGNAGYILESTDFANPPEELFVFLESGKMRIYAIREAGQPWDYFGPGTYFAPVASAGVGSTWGFMPDDFGNPSVATLEGIASETVPAGTFNAIWCVGRLVSDPAVIIEEAYFVSGTGLIREYFPADSSTDELNSFNVVGGSGYFPLAVGNWWEYDQLASAVGDLPGTPNLLHAAVPNPFNPSTKISFEMATAGHARLAIYDAAGRHVRTLVDGQRAAGSHAMTWDGRDNSGQSAAAGVYLYRFEAGRSVQTRTMTLVK